jgi:hypothetical protein
MTATQGCPSMERRRIAASNRTLAIAVAGCVALGGPLSAQIIASKPVTGKPIQVKVLEANAEARVQGGSPTVNFPTGDLWLGLPDKTAFIHFDLRSIPAGAAIMEAELLLTFRDSYSEPGPHTIQLGGVQGSWRETTVTYSNQPSVAWSNRSRTVSSPGTMSFNVKPAVDAWLSGQHDNNGFALRGDGPLKNAISREAATATDRPRLRIKYVAP